MDKWKHHVWIGFYNWSRVLLLLFSPLQWFWIKILVLPLVPPSNTIQGSVPFSSKSLVAAHWKDSHTKWTFTAINRLIVPESKRRRLVKIKMPAVKVDYTERRIYAGSVCFLRLSFARSWCVMAGRAGCYKSYPSTIKSRRWVNWKNGWGEALC